VVVDPERSFGIPILRPRRSARRRRARQVQSRRVGRDPERRVRRPRRRALRRASCPHRHRRLAAACRGSFSTATSAAMRCPGACGEPASRSSRWRSGTACPRTRRSLTSSGCATLPRPARPYRLHPDRLERRQIRP
jgi:hypothetical protein